jgi:hypothetical protein
LPALLVCKRTRSVGVLVAWAFHTGISLSMPVYTFGAQMAVLVLAFWPRTTPELLVAQASAGTELGAEPSVLAPTTSSGLGVNETSP